MKQQVHTDVTEIHYNSKEKVTHKQVTRRLCRDNVHVTSNRDPRGQSREIEEQSRLAEACHVLQGNGQPPHANGLCCHGEL